jgi:hypothetical protein
MDRIACETSPAGRRHTIEKIVGDSPEGRVLAALRFGPQSLLFDLRVDLFADQIEPSARLVACGVDR